MRELSEVQRQTQINMCWRFVFCFKRTLLHAERFNLVIWCAYLLHPQPSMFFHSLFSLVSFLTCRPNIFNASSCGKLFFMPQKNDYRYCEVSFLRKLVPIVGQLMCLLAPYYLSFLDFPRWWTDLWCSYRTSWARSDPPRNQMWRMRLKLPKIIYRMQTNWNRFVHCQISLGAIA